MDVENLSVGIGSEFLGTESRRKSAGEEWVSSIERTTFA